MSAPLNPVGGGACCAPSCSDAPAFRVPGPAGENAFTFTTASFVMPAVGLTVVVSVIDALWIGVGQTIFIEGAGNMAVASISGNNVTVSNPGYAGNTNAGVTVASGKKVSPGGVGGNSGNAYTNTTANFTMPAVLGTVQITVLNTAWMVAGEPIFISNAGTLLVSSIQSGILVTVVNLGYSENAAPTTVIPGGQAVTPTGFKGNTGASGLGTLDSISPTTTKGDLIVDNGGNSPNASDVRLGVGTNGQLLASDSVQPTGLGWKTVAPNSVATDGDIAIFSGTSGKPNPIKDSLMLITSDGAIQSTPTGGNARGSKAVDLQVDRAGATQVASGANSVIAGGKNNTASAADSAVAAGQNNLASGVDSFVGGGNTNAASALRSSVCAGVGNTASNTDAFVGGGQINTASGIDSSVVAGANNTASGQYSSIGGGSSNSASDVAATVSGGQINAATGYDSCIPGGQGAKTTLFAQMSHAAGFFAAAGDAQTSELLWRIGTTDATANVEAFLDGAAVRAVIPLNTTWGFIIHTIARSSAGVCAMWETKGAIQNIAGTVTLVAAVSQSVIADGTGATWGVTGNHVISADNVNKSLKVAVTGAAVTTIRWVTHARLVEINF